MVVCAATYKRPKSLLAMLESLAAQTAVAVGRLCVVVIDNDADGAHGLAVARSFRSDDRLDVVVDVCPQRGITAARNRSVEVAFQHAPDLAAVVFIDDDMTVAADWLELLVAGVAEHSAALGSSRVEPRFEVDPPGLLLAGGYFSPPNHVRGPIALGPGTGGLLVTAAVFERLGRAPFDDVFGLSGGEDIDLLMQCRKAGFVTVWVDDAVAYELVPASRGTAAWIIARERRIGSANVLLQRRGRPGVGAEAVRVAKTAGLFAVATVALAVRRDAAARLAARVRLARARGKLHAHLGRGAIDEYTVIHGN